MIAIVDYGRGNLHSVANALESIGEDVRLASTPEDLAKADRIVLPGVGAFPAGMRNLHDSGLVDSLEEQVRRRGKPFLGICLGLQFLAVTGVEGVETPGLGWVSARVFRLPAEKQGLKLPHVGWNETVPVEGSPLFAGMGRSPVFYYVHSYAMDFEGERGPVDAYCDYGGPFVAAVRFGNIAATQFHPEKSQDVGLRFLMNWIEWNP